MRRSRGDCDLFFEPIYAKADCMDTRTKGERYLLAVANGTNRAAINRDLNVPYHTEKCGTSGDDQLALRSGSRGLDAGLGLGCLRRIRVGIRIFRGRMGDGDQSLHI